MYTNCNWRFWYSHFKIKRGPEGRETKRTIGDHSKYCISEIGQNTAKSSCCDSNSSERPSTNADNNNINNNNNNNLLLANKPYIVSWGKERILQRIPNHSRVTLHRPAHSKGEQDQMEKYSYGLDWLEKYICYGSAKLDNKLLQNVQNIRWSHKLYRGNHENPEIGIDSRS